MLLHAQSSDSVTQGGIAVSYFLYPDTSALRLQTTIQFKENSISGITIAKFRNDTIRGVLMNEFGVKAFQFTIVGNDCKISQPISQLNKKYILRTLQQDFAFAFAIQKTGDAPYSVQKIQNSTERIVNNKKTGELICQSDTVIMNNTQRGIRYTFIPIL